MCDLLMCCYCNSVPYTLENKLFAKAYDVDMYYSGIMNDFNGFEIDNRREKNHEYFAYAPILFVSGTPSSRLILNFSCQILH